MNTNGMTKAGIAPVKSQEKYEYSTSMVEQYLREKRVGLLKDPKLANTNVMVITMDISPKFLPFMVLLPTSVIQGNGKRQQSNDELTIFNPDNSEGSRINLAGEIYGCIAPYVYNKADEQAFFSPDWRRERAVPASTSPKLKYSRTPHIQEFNKGKLKLVSVMIDPIRIFHDMVTDINNPNEQFKIRIDSIEKIKTGEYIYTFYKDPVSNNAKKKNKNEEELIAIEIAKKMRR